MDIEDYPRTILEFEQRFATGEACRRYLFQLRWPEGFCCPRCGHRQAWATKRRLYRCRQCDYQVSVTAGTIFQDTRKPLRLWFRAIWHVTGQKIGVSSLGLQRVLGLPWYETTWTWLQKLRVAMVRPGRDRLSGIIEVDETYVGGEQPGKRGRGRGVRLWLWLRHRKMKGISDAFACVVFQTLLQKVFPKPYKILWHQAVWCTRMAGVDMGDRRLWDTSTRWFGKPAMLGKTCCHWRTAQLRCLNDGCWEHIRERFVLLILITPLMSLPSDSIEGPPAPEENSSIVWSNRPFKSSLLKEMISGEDAPIPSNTIYRGYGSQPDTPKL